MKENEQKRKREEDGKTEPAQQQLSHHRQRKREGRELEIRDMVVQKSSGA